MLDREWSDDDRPEPGPADYLSHRLWRACCDRKSGRIDTQALTDMCVYLGVDDVEYALIQIERMTTYLAEVRAQQ